MLEIIRLVREKNLEELKKLKNEQGDKFNANERDKGMCALHFAANKGDMEIVKWLVDEAGADINAALKIDPYQGFTPLFLAIHKHDPNNPDEAKRIDMIPLITYLLNHTKLNIYATLNERNYQGRTAQGNFADKNVYGYTALLFALHLEKKDVVTTILDSKAGKAIISTRSAHGQGSTPFSKAAAAGREFTDIAQRLRMMNADTTISFPSNSAQITPTTTPHTQRFAARTGESHGAQQTNAELISAQREKMTNNKADTDKAETETTLLIPGAKEPKEESCCFCSIQ